MKKQLLQFLLAITVLLAACGSGDEKGKPIAEGKKKYKRYNANSPEGQKALAAMQKAIDSMKKMDCSNVLSLYYQGAMHWIPDTITNNPLCNSYQNKSQLKKAWDNCTHIEGIEINFLAWHRLYIWHFEKIVRQLSGDQDFALPYWGYTDTTNVVANRTMNQLFRTTASSLFEKSRFDSLNQGYPIHGDIVKALNLTKLFKMKDVFFFTQSIDRAPHGAMHNYIGAGNGNVYDIFNPIYNCNCNNTGPNNDTCNGGLMANVPSAGFDPIFYLHHSNIDRIWQQWTNSANGSLITAEDLKKYPWGYTFFNPDGSTVTYDAQQVIDAIYNVDYDYDDTPTPKETNDKKKKPALLLSTQNFADTLVTTTINKTVKGKSLSFSVRNNPAKLTPILKGKANVKEAAKAVIVGLTVSFIKEPKGIYQVFINQPKGQTASVDSDYFAGFLTFFGAKHHAKHGATAHANANGTISKTFYFEMTDLFNDKGLLTKPSFDVAILNEDGKGLTDIQVEKVSIILK